MTWLSDYISLFYKDVIYLSLIWYEQVQTGTIFIKFAFMNGQMIIQFKYTFYVID